jgi:hypothetical protein
MRAKPPWGPLALLCLAVAAYGAYCCLFGVEALVSGANVASWVEAFVLLVALPLAGLTFCIFRLVRAR